MVTETFPRISGSVTRSPFFYIATFMNEFCDADATIHGEAHVIFRRQFHQRGFYRPRVPWSQSVKIECNSITNHQIFIPSTQYILIVIYRTHRVFQKSKVHAPQPVITWYWSQDEAWVICAACNDGVATGQKPRTVSVGQYSIIS